MPSSRNGNRAGCAEVAVREGAHVVEMQRRRLLRAVVELVDGQGARALTVATICERASLSRRTFYELFEDREACLLAAFEDGVGRAARVVEQSVGDRRDARGRSGWKDRLRSGLIALLTFLDRDTGTARLLVVDALACGERTLEARRIALARLIAIVDEGRGLAGAIRGEGKATQRREPPPLTAEGVVGAVFGVVHARLIEREQRPLLELVGALMAMIVQPYLGPAAAERELERPVTVEQQLLVPRPSADPFKGLPMRLTYRTVRVLSSIADTPGASNKQVARAAGIGDEGQTSKLLTRLQRYGLIHDDGLGPAKGMSRAWSLTDRGEGVLQAVGGG